MPKELVHPPREVLEAVIAEAIAPAIKRLRKELDKPVPIQVTVWSPTLVGPKVLVGFEDDGGDPPQPLGELRLSFRETFVEGRYLFFGELVLGEEPVKGTGYSGFDIQGEARISGDDVTIRIGSKTNKHNVWRFRGWT